MENSYLKGLLNEGDHFSQRAEGFDFIKDTLTKIR
jgi:hypothetical protein